MIEYTIRFKSTEPFGAILEAASLLPVHGGISIDHSDCEQNAVQPPQLDKRPKQRDWRNDPRIVWDHEAGRINVPGTLAKIGVDLHDLQAMSTRLGTIEYAVKASAARQKLLPRDIAEITHSKETKHGKRSKHS
jgi:hypothetical protein